MALFAVDKWISRLPLATGVEMIVRAERTPIRERCGFGLPSRRNGYGVGRARLLGMGRMRRSLFFVAALAACAGPKLPPPNSAAAHYDGREQAVQLKISGLQPPTAAALVADDGARYPAAGITLVSGPHVLYNPPPEIGLGIGGFGFSGCCSGFGSGLGIG
jgi:hypothetical protein